jgi:hypothetical protein
VASNSVTTPPDPPGDWFTPPGRLRISAAAIELARAFHEQVRKAAPDEDWVISFDWADSRSVRDKDNSEWRDVET